MIVMMNIQMMNWALKQDKRKLVPEITRSCPSQLVDDSSTFTLQKSLNFHCLLQLWENVLLTKSMRNVVLHVLKPVPTQSTAVPATVPTVAFVQKVSFLY